MPMMVTESCQLALRISDGDDGTEKGGMEATHLTDSDREGEEEAALPN